MDLLDAIRALRRPRARLLDLPAPFDQDSRSDPGQARHGADRHKAALRSRGPAGGYRLIDWTIVRPELAAATVVQIAAGGIMVPEAVDAARVCMPKVSPPMCSSSPALSDSIRLPDARRAATGTCRRTARPRAPGDADSGRRAASADRHRAGWGLAFDGLPWFGLGRAGRAARCRRFRQSGSRADLYHATGIDADQIVNAAMLALDLVGA